MDITGKLKQAFNLAERREYDAAIQLCNGVLEEDPTNADALRRRAFTLARMNHLSEAIADMQTANKLLPLDPNDDFFCGYWSAELGEASQAIIFLTKVVEHEAARGDSHFSETARFFRSSAYLARGEGELALDDLAHVRSDFRTFLRDGLVSRSDLEQAALKIRKRSPNA